MNVNKVFTSLSEKLDILAAICGLLFSFILFFIGGNNLYYILGILILIPCIIWLIINENNFFYINLPNSKYLVKFWAILYFVVYSISIIILYSRPTVNERPLFYLILLSVLAGIIVCEIFTSNRYNVPFILFQIILLGICISWSQTLIFPGFIGVDDWYHFNIVKKIFDTYIIPEDFIYSSFPILHLLIVFISILVNFPIKISALLSISVGQIICNTLFIYILSSFLLKNHRIGLLSAFFLIIGDIHIRFSYLTYPNAFSFIFVLIIIFLIIFKTNEKPRHTIQILILFFMVMIILTHPLTSTFMAVSLFLLSFSAYFYQNTISKIKHKISIILPVFFTAAMLAYWAYVSMTTQTLAKLISLGFSPDILAKTTLDLGVDFNNNFFDLIFSVLPYYLFVTSAFIGLFFLISQKSNNSNFLFGILLFFPITIPFIFYQLGMEAVSIRWFYFSQVLLSIPLSLVVYVIGGRIINKSSLNYLFLFGIILICCFIMISCTMGNHDNFSVPPQNKIKIYHTESELTGLNFITHTSRKSLSVDGFSIPVLLYYFHWDSYHQIDRQYISGNFIQDDSFKILRPAIIANFQRAGILSNKITPDIKNYMLKNGFNQIYDNSGVIIFG